MTSYKVRASLPGSKGKIRCEVGKVATREEQFAIQNKLKLYIESNRDLMNAENFKDSCKSYVEENDLIRKGHSCEHCNKLFTISKSYMNHLIWCSGQSSSKKKKQKPASGSGWSKGSDSGYASDFKFFITGTVFMSLLFENDLRLRFQHAVPDEVVEKCYENLIRILSNPMNHELELDIENAIVLEFEKVIGFRQCRKMKRLFMGGKMKFPESDRALLDPESCQITALVQTKKTFHRNELKSMFNQHCAHIVAHVQHNLQDVVDFENVASLKHMDFETTYEVPVLVSIASSWINIMYAPEGISGSTIKAISLGQYGETELTLFIEIEKRGRKWFNVHSTEDLKDILFMFFWAMERSSNVNNETLA
jgi:hypothetical protein